MTPLERLESLPPHEPMRRERPRRPRVKKPRSRGAGRVLVYRAHSVWQAVSLALWLRDDGIEARWRPERDERGLYEVVIHDFALLGAALEVRALWQQECRDPRAYALGVLRPRFRWDWGEA
ncbi:hypothetical protein [Calidithermus chliarophilus]|uniref:hypothetical protein n=1 Tax=Calidithermus chliarophilus TaxID=52023 RepID=UPI00040FA23B|nr:hypothetical protein [Calidithermus chliarophilus]